ncbi:unnamed protein product [Prunus armeniaca]
MLMFFLGLHPMQLNPNSYILISGFLAVGLKWGVTLSFKDFIYLYDLACVKGESHYFFFTFGSGKKVFSCKPTSSKYWKNQPPLITGEWAAPKMFNMPISLAFGRKPGLTNLFFGSTSFGQKTCSKTFVPSTLNFVAEDSTSLIQASFQEREVELAQHNSSEHCVSGFESDQSDMSAPCSLSIPGHRERRPGKEPKLSGFAKKSRHASQVVLGLGSPNVFASSTLSRPQQVPRAPTPVSSLGENDFTTIIDEHMWGYQSQCLNAMIGIRKAQMARFQAMSREICEKRATIELSENRIKECETELE